MPSGTNLRRHASDARIDSTIHQRKLAIVMNKMQHLHRPGSMSLAQWALCEPLRACWFGPCSMSILQVEKRFDTVPEGSP